MRMLIYRRKKTDGSCRLKPKKVKSIDFFLGWLDLDLRESEGWSLTELYNPTAYDDVELRNICYLS